MVDPTGHHDFSCRKSAGRQRRHALANDILARAFRAAGVQAELEPHLLHGIRGRRLDGATLDSGSVGLPLAWDFTCPDTLAQSHVAQSATGAGEAASKAEQGNITKYGQLAALNSLAFAPVAIETLGSWGPLGPD